MSSQSATARATFVSDDSQFATRTDVYRMRPVRRDDIKGLSRMMSQVFAYELGRDETWRSNFQETVVESLYKYFEKNNPHGLVGLVCDYRATDGTLKGVGYISMQTSNVHTPLNNPLFKEVEGLFVLPQHRKKGIATHLLNQIIFHAEEIMRTEELAADIPTSMTAAASLFSKVKFVAEENATGRWVKRSTK